MMKRLYILCGIAFSGKTTVARKLSQVTGSVYISLDDINAERGLLGGDGVAGQEWERTHEVARQRMSSFMTEGQDIVLDDTSCFRWLRERYREFAHRNGYVAQIVYLEVPPDELRRRIAENTVSPRRRAISPAVLAEHIRSFEKPSADEEAVVLDSPQSASDWIASQHKSRTCG
jgi:predicted kinase